MRRLRKLGALLLAACGLIGVANEKAPAAIVFDHSAPSDGVDGSDSMGSVFGAFQTIEDFKLAAPATIKGMRIWLTDAATDPAGKSDHQPNYYDYLNPGNGSLTYNFYANTGSNTPAASPFATGTDTSVALTYANLHDSIGREIFTADIDVADVSLLGNTTYWLGMSNTTGLSLWAIVQPQFQNGTTLRGPTFNGTGVVNIDVNGLGGSDGGLQLYDTAVPADGGTVPEPASAGLLAAAAGGMALRRRRRTT